MTRRYLTVPADLVDTAERLAKYQEVKGFRVKLEPQSLDFPFPPTFLCKRGHTTKLVEVLSVPDRHRIDTWARYGRSCSGDTRVVFGVPGNSRITSDLEATLRQAGIGLCRVETEEVIESVAARDLALNLELPKLEEMPARLRAKLGPAYERFEASDWRGGFEDACQALEIEAREYLIRGMSTSPKRITFINEKGKELHPSVAKIRKLPIGALAEWFGRIASPNQNDSQLEGALRRVNPDRVGVVHHPDSARAERHLRENVGRHMWVVYNALRILHEHR